MDANNNNELMPNLITLTDDNGEEHNFEQLDYLKNEKGEYVALVPFIDNTDALEDYDGELLVLKVVKAANSDEEMLYFIEDEDEFNEISSIFIDRLSEEFDFEESEDEDDDDDVEVIE